VLIHLGIHPWIVINPPLLDLVRITDFLGQREHVVVGLVKG
jgi:hypothetical protein